MNYPLERMPNSLLERDAELLRVVVERPHLIGILPGNPSHEEVVNRHADIQQETLERMTAGETQAQAPSPESENESNNTNPESENESDNNTSSPEPENQVIGPQPHITGLLHDLYYEQAIGAPPDQPSISPYAPTLELSDSENSSESDNSSESERENSEQREEEQNSSNQEEGMAGDNIRSEESDVEDSEQSSKRINISDNDGKGPGPSSGGHGPGFGGGDNSSGGDNGPTTASGSTSKMSCNEKLSLLFMYLGSFLDNIMDIIQIIY